MLLCALVGPLFPPFSAPRLLFVSFLDVMSAFSVVFFLFFSLVSPWSRSPLLPRALRVLPALLRATPVSPPLAPSLARVPSHSRSLSRPCLFGCPLFLCRCVTRVCHPRALPLPLSVVPTLFPGVSPTLVFPRSLSLTSSWMPCGQCGGGVYLRTGLWPCPRTGTTLAFGVLRTMTHRIFRRYTERTTVKRLSNSLRCICTVEPSCRDQPRRFGTEPSQSDQCPQSGA